MDTLLYRSATRQPTQVFTLLETLYGAYDELADRRGVYKVKVFCLFVSCTLTDEFLLQIETIGDSYVAVCGLPNRRDDHAVAITKFAVDIRKKTNELSNELVTTLGKGTEHLQMRIGLHSGSVTAGILRGQRARFQLFGDTVNTASRMESNGVANKIQVSQSTADLLIAAGKASWLTKRDELVMAKGKGSMQTYWVDPPTRAEVIDPTKPGLVAQRDSGRSVHA